MTCAVAVASLGVVLAGCGKHTAAQKPAAAPSIPVAVTNAPATPNPVTVGVIYTESAGQQGYDVSDAAEGAVVASYRLNKGGAAVTLDAQPDLGTAAGAKAAEQKLVADGAAAIVVLSTGPHLAGAVQAASAAGIAVLLPYDDGSDLPAGLHDVWFTGPTLSAQVSAVNRAVANDQNIAVVSSRRLPADLSGLVPAVKPTVLSVGAKVPAAVTKAGAVVVWDAAQPSAQLVAQLQQAQVQGTVVLSQTAQWPTFAAALAAAQSKGNATLSAPFDSVGEAVSDYTDSTAMAGFFAAVRAAASDPAVKALDGVTDFGPQQAQDADTRSYDAVMAVVTAATRAGSSQPSQVTDTLSGLSLTDADGLLGPALDFTRPDALAADGTAILRSASQPGSPRGISGTTTPTLSWFVLPGKE